jgi:hypothetical protein
VGPLVDADHAGRQADAVRPRPGGRRPGRPSAALPSMAPAPAGSARWPRNDINSAHFLAALATGVSIEMRIKLDAQKTKAAKLKPPSWNWERAKAEFLAEVRRSNRLDTHRDYRGKLQPSELDRFNGLVRHRQTPSPRQVLADGAEPRVLAAPLETGCDLLPLRKRPGATDGFVRPSGLLPTEIKSGWFGRAMIVATGRHPSDFQEAVEARCSGDRRRTRDLEARRQAHRQYRGRGSCCRPGERINDDEARREEDKWSA